MSAAPSVRSPDIIDTVREPDDTSIVARVKHAGSTEAFEPGIVGVSERGEAVLLDIQVIGPGGKPVFVARALMTRADGQRLWGRLARSL